MNSQRVSCIDEHRRLIVGVAALGAVSAPLAVLSSASARALAGAASMTPGSASAASTPLGPLKHVRAGVLDVAYVDSGPADGPPVFLLHGWPYDIHSYQEVVPLLVAAGHRVVVPYLRGYGETKFASSDAVRNGQPAAMADDVVQLMDALHIRKALLAGFDWGARSAAIVAALWPDRVSALVSVSGYLIGSQQAALTPLPPGAELQWWYQYYFATERGRAGYDQNRRDFARLIWKLASPQWMFDDTTFERSAAALENPDHVAIVIHNYRWRLALAKGEARYDEIERKLAASPSISVPTITIEGDANGAPHPAPESYAGRFTGPYEHRLFTGGIGHNAPQESPREFARAVIDAAGIGPA